MIDLRKLRSTFPFANFTQNHLIHKPPQNPRFHSTKKPIQSKVKPFPKSIVKEAQAALLEYLHSTRSLQFSDADNMCKNSPFFLQDLLKKTQIHNKHKAATTTTAAAAAAAAKHSISRYLRYHPINEFEPFFESVGLKPSEYASLLPRDMMFLNDDALLMENYQTLCNFGVQRTKVGRIFKRAPEVFRYESGVLSLKLKAYEELGVAASTLVDAVAASPSLLVGDVDLDFVKVVEKLKEHFVAKGGGWVEEHFLDGGVYCNWGMVLRLLCLLSEVGFSEGQIDELIRDRPCVVFQESGGRALSLIAFLSKFGLAVDRIALMFLEFPQIRIDKFYTNLRRCLQFLTEIEMQGEEIGSIFQSHTLLLGSFTMKKTKSLLVDMNVGRKRLCRMVQDNPQEMKNWAMGIRVQPMVSVKAEQQTMLRKTEFLVRWGFVENENSENLKEAFKLFRGRGTELQERFDLIVNAGVDSEDVRKMLRVSPQIINQSIDRIKMKMEYLVKEGYSISDLVTFPSFLSYTPSRVKLRLSMYNWLKDQGVADAGLALSTTIACTERIFIQQYVKRHPSGLQVWQKLKKEILSED
ncbi:transcription termination factor MTEF18, mitochondrial-like [Lotus japonicus]|uniref:transcription termination factor MTEF18, mitochondrial-like n=1 Tax=Lotus japonicus TaxID=34305 RepID=UPI0025854349|nr:transcription termination factor MTEF18, mitochondrial-like [Lotus japonicus]